MNTADKGEAFIAPDPEYFDVVRNGLSTNQGLNYYEVRTMYLGFFDSYTCGVCFGWWEI
jgi:hypothetical protein